jgi:hypothetical protein
MKHPCFASLYEPLTMIARSGPEQATHFFDNPFGSFQFTDRPILATLWQMQKAGRGHA